MGRLVRYMLFASYEKPGTPVTRAKLNDLLTADNKNHKNAKKLLTRTLPEAQVLSPGVVYYTDLKGCLEFAPMNCESPCSGSPCETPHQRIHPREHEQMVVVVQAAVQTATND